MRSGLFIVFLLASLWTPAASLAGTPLFEVESGDSARSPASAVVSVTGAVGDGSWRAFPSPPTRSLHAAVYDPTRDRLVSFGGFARGFLGVLEPRLHAYWLGEQRWGEIAVTGPHPEARRDHSLVLDLAGDRLVLFGGWNGSRFLDDVWEFPLDGSSEWRRIETGAGPGPRAEHAAIIDPIARTMWVFGGFDGAARSDETWILDLSGTPAWTRVDVAGETPTARHSHSAVLDSELGEMLVFGGWDGAFRSDVWGLTLDGSPRWRRLQADGGGPRARKDHLAAFDPGSERLIVHGGFSGSHLDDTWAWSRSGGWTPVAPGSAAPPARRDAAGGFDSRRGRLLLFAGWDGAMRRDLWSLALRGGSGWAPIPPQVVPRPRGGHSGVLDPNRDHAVIYGGAAHQSRWQEVWIVPMVDPMTYFWVPSAGDLPPPLDSHAHVFDAKRRRHLLFGGREADHVYPDDVWELTITDSARWRRLVIEEPRPPGRRAHVGVLDPRGDQLVIFGGYRVKTSGSGVELLNDVWALLLDGEPRWVRLEPEGEAPPGWAFAAGFYDPLRHRVWIVGGAWPRDSGFELVSETWALELSEPPRWRRIETLGEPPPGRYGHSAIYDALGDRGVLYGGVIEFRPRSDAWALDLEPQPTWRPLFPTGLAFPAGSPASFYDAGRDRMVSLLDATHTQVLEWNRLPKPSPLPGRVEWLAMGPNPFRGQIEFGLRVPQATAARIEVFDLGGRRIREIFRGSLEAGEYTFAWGGRDGAGARVPVGVYFLRVQAGADRFAAKLVHLP